MTRKLFSHMLEQTRDDVIQMGQMVEMAIRHSLNALQRWDSLQAQWVIDADTQINNTRYQIEVKIEGLLATQQPIVASDLRFVTAIIAIVNELERIGDYAKDIALRIQRVVGGSAVMDMPTDLVVLGDRVQQMLSDSLQSFVDCNEEMARRLATTDDEADQLEELVRQQILQTISADVRLLEAGTMLLDVAHMLERVGDRATNIGERVIFVATAQIVELNP